MERTSFKNHCAHEGWIVVEETAADQKSPPSLALPSTSSKTDTKQIAKDHTGDDDFFEIIRKRHLTYDEKSEEEINETIVDSTPSTMVLVDPYHPSNDEMPDLVFNISPTSLSTATSNNNENRLNDSKGKEISICDEPMTTSESTTTTSAYYTTSRYLLRFAISVAFVMSSANYLFRKEGILQAPKLFSFTPIKYNTNQIEEIEEKQTPFDLGHYQDAFRRLQFDDLFENIVEQANHNSTTSLDNLFENIVEETNHNSTTSSDENHNSTTSFDEEHIQQQGFDQNIDTKEKYGADEVVWQELEVDDTTIPHDTFIQDGGFSPQSSEEDELLSTFPPASISFKKLYVRSNDILQCLRQMANVFAAAASELAKQANEALYDLAPKIAEIYVNEHLLVGYQEPLKYVWKATNNIISNTIRQITNVAEHVNKVFDDLASKNAEIHASKLSTVGSRESLIHVWEAAESMMYGFIRRVSGIAQHANRVLDDLASKNAEIYASKLYIQGDQKPLIHQVKTKLSIAHSGMETRYIMHMDGVRESFTNIKGKIRKQTSRMMSRKIRINPMMIYI